MNILADKVIDTDIFYISISRKVKRCPSIFIFIFIFFGGDITGVLRFSLGPLRSRRDYIKDYVSISSLSACLGCLAVYICTKGNVIRCLQP